jgi:hypothetical protein
LRRPASFQQQELSRQLASLQQGLSPLLASCLLALVDLLNFYEVSHCANHAAQRVRVFFDDDVANSLEPEGAHGFTLIWLATNFTLDLGNF